MNLKLLFVSKKLLKCDFLNNFKSTFTYSLFNILDNIINDFPSFLQSI